MKDEQKSKKDLITELEALRRENKQLRGKQTKKTDPQRTGKTILIVDDNENTREIVTAIVTELGYSTIEEENPQQAINRFSRDPSAIDLVLSDIVMPNGGGPEMIDTMAKITPGIKVIFMSGYAEDEIVHDAVFKIQHSCAVFIKKPFTMTEIEPLIKNQIGV